MRTFHTRMSFRTFEKMPWLVYQALQRRDDMTSQTEYLQRAVCEALSRDLGLDMGELMAALPPHRTNSLAVDPGKKKRRYMAEVPNGGVARIGQASTAEEVK